jgi:demethylmenaquinone methyltransferase/2-methoxy-6-polyprenyl-1,4-benzoquinol methylase
MSSLALMRWLEGSPERYDAGMRTLTLGRIERLHAAVAEAAVPDEKARARVLEIGCGTGAVTALLVSRGAAVTALDQAPEMLEQAKARLGADACVEWLEQTASEIDRLPQRAFDAVVLSLCLSDMSRSERVFVLREASLRLAAGGRLVVADETRAEGWRRGAQLVWRVPQAALGWLLVGSVSQPIPNLVREVESTGLSVTHEASWLGGTLRLAAATVRDE